MAGKEACALPVPDFLSDAETVELLHALTTKVHRGGEDGPLERYKLARLSSHKTNISRYMRKCLVWFVSVVETQDGVKCPTDSDLPPQPDPALLCLRKEGPPMNMIKIERPSKTRHKRPHRSYRASTYLTVTEYAALERVAAAQRRTVAGLVRAIVLGSWARRMPQAVSHLAPRRLRRPEAFPVVPANEETPRQQDQDGLKRAEWQRSQRAGQESLGKRWKPRRSWPRGRRTYTGYPKNLAKDWRVRRCRRRGYVRSRW